MISKQEQHINRVTANCCVLYSVYRSMTVATVSLCCIAQLIVQPPGLQGECFGVQNSSTGALDQWELEVVRPGASWIAC